jgi:hypothetical protein
MRIVDNIIALRILWLLITPFEKTDAYKLGLISDQGEFIKKAKTPQEVNASSMLHRLVWRIKKFINMVPGGSTKIGSLVAAYALVRECIEKDNYLPDTSTLNESTYVVTEEETEILNSFLELNEEMANVAGAGVATDAPKIKGKRAKGTFSVSDDTFKKFKSGKAKFRRWGAYLNLDDDTDREIYHYAKKNPRGILVLQDNNGNSKGIRYSKHGGGNWHGIKRKPKNVVESYLEELDYEMECVELC